MLSSTSTTSSVKTCLWPRRYLTRVFIYSNSISNLVTIKMKFSLSIASSLHSLGILALEISDTFNFAFFLFASLPHRLFSPRWLKPLQKSWRSRGIPIAIFLDDGLGGGADHISAKLILVFLTRISPCGSPFRLSLG